MPVTIQYRVYHRTKGSDPVATHETTFQTAQDALEALVTWNQQSAWIHVPIAAQNTPQADLDAFFPNVRTLV